MEQEFLQCHNICNAHCTVTVQVVCLGDCCIVQSVLFKHCEVERIQYAVTRQINCDSANTDKTVAASRAQLDAIKSYVKLFGLDALPDTCAACPKREEWARMKAESVGAWEDIQNGPDNYLLIQMKDGTLYLIQGDQMYQLERTDLLGVSIRQPGIEAYVEPVWYATDSWAWMPEEMSATLVDSDARIVLMPEQEVDMLLVSEEYYQRQPDGETSITVTDHVLERDAKGDFALEVSRRGDAGDDFAVYHVTVGEDHYAFRLTFPMVPGETSVAVGVPEQWREVRYEEHGAFITLQLPESWSYAVTSIDDESLDAGIAGGITFWPLGREDGKLFFGFYPQKAGIPYTGRKMEHLIDAFRPKNAVNRLRKSHENILWFSRCRTCRA